MSVNTIEAQIESLVGEITTIEATYDYPVFQLGRSLPALVIIYDGIEQDYEAVGQTETTYRFQFTLYQKAEGKNLKTNWNDIKTVATDILDKFRKNPTLNNTVWNSIITSGETIISEIDDNALLGHTFVLEATQTES